MSPDTAANGLELEKGCSVVAPTDYGVGDIRRPSIGEFTQTFKFKGKLGKGGFAIVYKVQMGGKNYALKVMLQGADSMATAMFFREAKAINVCKHRSVVTSYGMVLVPAGVPEIKNTAPRWAILMELCEDGSLQSKVIERMQSMFPGRVYSEREALSWCEDIADALAFMHNHEPPYVHRDIKSENILLTRAVPGGPLQAKLCDFGLHTVLDFRRGPPMLVRRTSRHPAKPPSSARASNDGTNGVSARRSHPIHQRQLEAAIEHSLAEGHLQLTVMQPAPIYELPYEDIHGEGLVGWHGTTAPKPRSPGAWDNAVLNPEVMAAVQQDTSTKYFVGGTRPSTPAIPGGAVTPSHRSSASGEYEDGANGLPAFTRIDHWEVASPMAAPLVHAGGSSKVAASSPAEASIPPRPATAAALEGQAAVSMQRPASPQDMAFHRVSSGSVGSHRGSNNGGMPAGGGASFNHRPPSAPASLASGGGVLLQMSSALRMQPSLPPILEISKLSNEVMPMQHQQHERPLVGVTVEKGLAASSPTRLPSARGVGGSPSSRHSGSGDEAGGAPGNTVGALAAQMLSAALDGELRDLQDDEFELVFNLTGKTGSAFYMPPEIYRQLHYNTKADVFSFAMLMYELLSGLMLSIMYAGDCETPEIAMARYPQTVVEGWRPPRPEKLPNRLWYLMTACWHPDAVARPDMNSVLQELRAIIRERDAAEGADAEGKGGRDASGGCCAIS